MNPLLRHAQRLCAQGAALILLAAVGAFYWRAASEVLAAPWFQLASSLVVPEAEAQTQPTPRSGWPALLPPPAGVFVDNEVLVSELKPGQLSKLQARGFEVHPLQPPQSGFRIVLPKDMSRKEAGELLPAELAVRHRYEVPAIEWPLETRSASEHSGPGCSSELCYARSVLHWRNELAACAESLRIGLIGTGVDGTLGNFSGRRLHQRAFHDATGAQPHWHGTAVLAVLAGNPHSTPPGLIPEAEFFVAAVFSRGPSGRPVTDTPTVLDALAWMEQSNVQIVNLAFASPRDAALEEAIARLSKKGMVFVAAAGDGGPAAPPSYPAAYADVIAVTAVDDRLRLYAFANRGSYIDVAAPGVLIWTVLPGDRHGFATGTSLAASYAVAAIAASYRSLPAGKSKAEVLQGLRMLQPTPGAERDFANGLGIVQAPTSCRP